MENKFFNYLCIKYIHHIMKGKDRIEYSGMKIPSIVKIRLDKLKGRRTYGDFLDSVLGYFEMNGIDPLLNQLPPAATISKAIHDQGNFLYKRLEDIIKIIRNIESSKIDVISHGIDDIKKGNINNQLELGPSDEEVAQLVSYNRQLESQIHQQETTIQELKNKKDYETIKNLIDTVRDLLFDKHLPKDTQQNRILSLDYCEKLIEKIREIGGVQ